MMKILNASWIKYRSEPLQQALQAIGILRSRVLFLGVLLIGQLASRAQTTVMKQGVPPTRTPVPADAVFRFRLHKPIPKRAALYSACIPGLGQIYNRQYWKTGLIYAGGAVISGFMISNYRNYQKYRKIYVGMIDNNPTTPDTYKNYTVEDVKYLQDGFQKYLEYTVLTATLAYTMNILDALISAHLRSFDMGTDISIICKPIPAPHGATALGLGIQVHM